MNTMNEMEGKFPDIIPPYDMEECEYINHNHDNEHKT